MATYTAHRIRNMLKAHWVNIIKAINADLNVIDKHRLLGRSSFRGIDSPVSVHLLQLLGAVKLIHSFYPKT
jgi:hypothetical protein